MSRLERGIGRIILHVASAALMPIELLNPRLFMRLFVALLSSYGIRFEGCPRYISTRVKFDDFKLITIGERTVISKYVILLTHDYSLTTALIAIGDEPPTDIAVRRKIEIGSNVFVGMSAVLLPGTRVGDNVIIGAGSVVRGDIPADSIITGNPAQRICALTEHPERWRRRRASANASPDRT